MLLRRLARASLDALLPPACLSCDAPVMAQGGFCADCFGQARLISEPCCARCGVPFERASDGPVCRQCLAAPPPWGEARAAFVYDAFSRRQVLALKHADRTDIAGALAPLMARAGRAMLARAELLVPVPLHRSRLLARRYNQAALLARAVGRRAGVAVLADALRRTRRTAPLGEKDFAARAAEMEGAVAVRPGRVASVAGRRVVLVDDVLTSGATARACASALLAAGATGVDVLVAARVPDPRLRDEALPDAAAALS